MAEQKTSNSSLVGFGILVLLTAMFYLYSWITDGKVWYAFQYSANLNQVDRPNKPHDCEWFSAPLGNKNCHYEATAIVYKSGTDKDGKPVRSYDAGKTWTYLVEGWDVIHAAAPANAKTDSVSIVWEKHED